MEPEPVPPARDRALGILATTAVLGILYLGREVLIPVTLAALLGMLITPAVNLLRRTGLGRSAAVGLSVLTCATAMGAMALLIGTQLLQMTANFPAYQEAIDHKLRVLEQLTQDGAEFVGARARPATRALQDTGAAAPAPRTPVTGLRLDGNAPIAVEIHTPPTSPMELLARIFTSLWAPFEMAGIVLVVLVFVLLEHDTLRDRFIRVAGGSDVRTTTLAINDAGERLSRFFVSQFAVNLGFGAVICGGLLLLGLPNAALWAVIASVLRFVPYIGVWIAALLASLLAAAVDPGWTLALWTFGLFAVVESITGQLVEPALYGHTTGLSPLSVVLAAIFWSCLWGPVGLVVSTPLTLCLLVAGRYFKALGVLDILLSDTHALTMPERFYQRALSGDADEIISNAREFLRRNSFPLYCDAVLVPAMHLAWIDLQDGKIDPEQQRRVREAAVEVIAVLGGATRKRLGRRKQSVLEDIGIGRHLRTQRERVSGKWQGPLQVAPGSVILCAGLGSVADELATELLVRVLADQKFDARSATLDELRQPLPLGANEDGVAIVFLVGAFPTAQQEDCRMLATELHARFPHALLVSLLMPGVARPQTRPADLNEGSPVEDRAHSFQEALQIALHLRERQARAGREQGAARARTAAGARSAA